MHNITNYPVLQWTPLAISNEREEIALLVVSPAGPPDGGNWEGRGGREETLEDQMSSLQSDAEM